MDLQIQDFHFLSANLDNFSKLKYCRYEGDTNLIILIFAPIQLFALYVFSKVRRAFLMLL